MVTIADRSTGLSDLWLYDLLTFDPINQVGPLWSLDGTRIYYFNGRAEIASMPVDGSARGETVFEATSPVVPASWSPDGKRLLMITSSSRTRCDISVLEVESTLGGTLARWRGDGRELFYLALDESIILVGVEARGSDLMLGKPQRLFQLSADGNYDVSADGQRFLVTTPAQREEQPPLSLVLNWTSELDKR